MDTVKRKNWFKRLFILDYDVQLAPLLESIDPILENIQIQQIEIDDTHLKIDGLSEAVKVVTSRVETVEGKLAALKTFDFFGRTVVAQFDFEKSIVGDTSITVSIDNVATQAFLRFGSATVVDTIDAVWFISKTGNRISNDFGDVLHPAAQRRDVKKFLYMTSEKQGDTPLDIIIPEHKHDNYAELEHTHPEYDGNSSDVNKAYVDEQDAAEAQERKDGDAQITADLAQEVADRADGDAEITLALQQEVKDREDADDALAEALQQHDHDHSHEHDQYATKIDLEELQVEVDALATTREAGRWTVAASAGVRPGEVHFVSSSMSTSDNLITVNDTDLNGTVHGWSNLEAGDFLEVVQETESVTKSVGSYGLFKITADNGGTGIRSMELALDQGSGDLAAGSNVFIKVFHANNDLDLAELDQRYALKGHTHETKAIIGRRFKYSTRSPSNGQFTIGGDIVFSFVDLSGTTRKMTVGPDFQWTTTIRMTVWNMEGELWYAAELQGGSNWASAYMKFYKQKTVLDRALVEGDEYDVHIESYW